MGGVDNWERLICGRFILFSQHFLSPLGRSQPLLGVSSSGCHLEYLNPDLGLASGFGTLLNSLANGRKFANLNFMSSVDAQTMWDVSLLSCDGFSKPNSSTLYLQYSQLMTRYSIKLLVTYTGVLFSFMSDMGKGQWKGFLKMATMLLCATT